MKLPRCSTHVETVLLAVWSYTQVIMFAFTTEREVITRGNEMSAMSMRCYEVIHQVALGE